MLLKTHEALKRVLLRSKQLISLRKCLELTTFTRFLLSFYKSNKDCSGEETLRPVDLPIIVAVNSRILAFMSHYPCLVGLW